MGFAVLYCDIQRPNQNSYKVSKLLQSAFSDKHRGDGRFLNIAIAAFVFAWSACAIFSVVVVDFAQRFTTIFRAAIVLTRIRWTDYLVPGPSHAANGQHYLRLQIAREFLQRPLAVSTNDGWTG